VPSFGERLEKVFAEKGQLCIGIDPSASQLASWGLSDSAQGAKEFSLEILRAAKDAVGIVKPQVAFFEQYGSAGIYALEEVLREANNLGFLVIADAKRGDIGSTMDGYAKAWLSKEAPFMADALTLSPYLGIDSLQDTVTTATSASKAVFVLAATSNPEAASLQTATANGESIAGSICRFAYSKNMAGLGSVGVVVGATLSLEDRGIDASLLSNTPILMPGFGQQGAELSGVRKRFKTLAGNLICNVSRSVAGVSKDGLAERISEANLQLALGLES
jgi:orotidine-5'-phosphate decarboxylase